MFNERCTSAAIRRKLDQVLHIYKRGDIYHIRGTVAYAGEAIKVRCTTGQSKKREAEEVCRSLEQRIINEIRGGVNLTPFSKAADLWVASKTGDTEHRNVDRLKKYFADIPISKINADEWVKFVSKEFHGCENSTINRIRGTLNAIANHSSAPIIIDKLPEEDERNRFLTIAEQNKLLASYPDFIRPYFITLCYQGFRRGEALRIQWQHVNLEAEVVTVWRKSKRHPKGKRQVVQLHKKTIEAIKSRPVHKHSYVFTNRFGDPYKNPDNVKGLHKRACIKANIHDFRIHDWRHHWASQMTMAGANFKTLMKLGGWATESMVTKYADVADEHTKSTLNKLK